jgi:adenosylmethionine-8-amino-7-oxononanoate aminotransferase
VLDAGGFPHGFTYAGNPLACAAGIAVIEEIERRGPDRQRRAHRRHG